MLRLPLHRGTACGTMSTCNQFVFIFMCQDIWGASVLTSSCDGAQIKPGSTSCPEFDEEPPSAMGKRKYDEYGDYAGNEDGSIWITATGIAKVTVFPRYFPRW